ncbi:preprotein translocase subunit SecY [Garciella nitratireducens]|uniref:Protein translocase subunit SecY n=1 Tax=Garciella nitratireducens DSM 15102 TaxID=1121911 RepID=A0A1T4PT49_9FIRM|nr:preprotein translocase subunit SecY [Garciella nitratireducens]RBP44899.1 protein translocase subunit secY/sec61 alpha [Garciella nitratireducens]SJZ94058.1 protein translocase subunit secY/sec61 alpha [Garciella nitratireducens DSM 15102]
MFTTLRDAWKIPDLRRKMLFTLAMLLVYRLGSFIPVPFINREVIQQIISQGGVLGFFDIVSGGNFSNFTIFAMSITPYINASIIFNLLTLVIPKLEHLAQEGEEGRRKLAQYTRYATIILALIQALGLSLSMKNVLVQKNFLTIATVIITITAGTAFLMWLGEQITEKGIGNGISLIIFVSIISRIPSGILKMVDYVKVGTISVITLIVFCVFAIFIIAAVVAVQEGQRKIPVQYAKRVVGRKMYGGQSTHIPLKINQSGVMPIIFASSITLFPATLASFFPNSSVANWIATFFAWGKPVSTIIYVLLIIAFTYFYTMISFNPVDIADNMKKNGGFIPGIRPGKPTAEYLKKTINRLTLSGAIFLAIIAILPLMLGILANIDLRFGGTSLLIIVGVSLETVKQIEAQMLMRNYQGFLK